MLWPFGELQVLQLRRLGACFGFRVQALKK